jgi:hypothetical protein
LGDCCGLYGDIRGLCRDRDLHRLEHSSKRARVGGVAICSIRLDLERSTLFLCRIM